VRGTMRTGAFGELRLNVSVQEDQEPPVKIEKGKKTVDERLLAKIRSIDQRGLLTLQFSKPLMQIANLTQISDRKALSL